MPCKRKNTEGVRRSLRKTRQMEMIDWPHKSGNFDGKRLYTTKMFSIKGKGRFQSNVSCT
jgi:hypothetical protein